MPGDSSLKQKILDFDPTVITKGYQKHIGSKPALESLILGGTLGYGAYKTAPWLVSKVMKTLKGRVPGMAGTDEDLDHAMQDMERSGELDTFAKRIGMGVGAAGMLYPFLRSTNFRGSTADAVRSYLGGSRYSQDEPVAKYNRDAHRKSVMEAAEKSHRLFKAGSFQDALIHQNIPISYSLDLIKTDTFLRDQDKTIASSLIEGSEGNSGLTNGQSIMRTAVRAGVGFIPAFTFGKAITSITGLPEPEAKRLSLAGGVAGAIYNTGIIQEFLRQ